jgi:uncharacterized protein YndB with AHSA1/START domain
MTELDTVPPIVLALDTRADPVTAWRTITEPERIGLWFTEASPLGEPGSAYRLDFGDGSVVTGVVTAHEPGVRFGHTWAWEADEPGDTTHVEWRVEALPEGGSRITLVHDRWTEAGSNTAARDDHEAYWSGYLNDLRDILEEG